MRRRKKIILTNDQQNEQQNVHQNRHDCGLKYLLKLRLYFNPVPHHFDALFAVIGSDFDDFSCIIQVEVLILG